MPRPDDIQAVGLKNSVSTREREKQRAYVATFGGAAGPIAREERRPEAGGGESHRRDVGYRQGSAPGQRPGTAAEQSIRCLEARNGVLPTCFKPDYGGRAGIDQDV